VLIPHQTFVDLFGGTQVDLVDDTPTERRCPCCERKMRSCRIAIDKVDLDHDTMYCRHDGVWLQGGLLEHILLATERDSHRDFPGEQFAHAAPGLFDTERQEAYEMRVQIVRDWFQYAWLGMGMLLALAAVAAAGWWCIITTCIIGVLAYWFMFLRGHEELGLVFRRPLTYVTAPVRSIPYRFRLPRYTRWR
jgi:Zn-finger nucleic acid-binding protein